MTSTINQFLLRIFLFLVYFVIANLIVYQWRLEMGITGKSSFEVKYQQFSYKDAFSPEFDALPESKTQPLTIPINSNSTNTSDPDVCNQELPSWGIREYKAWGSKWNKKHPNRKISGIGTLTMALRINNLYR